MGTISVCMIVKNEGAVIYKTLQTIKELFDEIIIVDTGSTDNTFGKIEEFISLEEGLKIKFHQFEWCDDYSAARNYSYSLATCDYITWWDANDVPGVKFKDIIQDIRDDKYHGIQMFCIPTVKKFNPDGSIKKWVQNDRIIRKDIFYSWQCPVHEYLIYKDVMDLKNSSLVVTFSPLECRIESNSGSEDTLSRVELYNRLIERGYEFTGHDYYFYIVDLLDSEFYTDVIKYINLGCSKDYSIYELGYFVLMYRHINENYRHLHYLMPYIDIILLLLRHGMCDAEVSCWFGDYLLNKGSVDGALIWYNNAMDNHLVGADGIVADYYRYEYPSNQIHNIMEFKAKAKLN